MRVHASRTLHRRAGNYAQACAPMSASVARYCDRQKVELREKLIERKETKLERVALRMIINSRRLDDYD